MAIEKEKAQPLPVSLAYVLGMKFGAEEGT